MRKPKVMALLLAISLLISVGCEKRESLPTEQDAQTALLHTVNQHNGFKVVSFKKVNGQRDHALGMDTYTIYYEAQVEYLKPDFTHRAGAIDTWKGNLSFQKTEKGWLGPDKEVY
jgi:hypothetical protein